MKNEPAFPHQELSQSIANEEAFRGLTKREYFAAMAMQGLCQTNHDSAIWYALKDDLKDKKKISKAAVLMADALIQSLTEVQSTGDE